MNTLSADPSASESSPAGGVGGNNPNHSFTLWLLFLVGIMAVWVAFLSYEVYSTANPVIVSRSQILAADLVVEGKPTAEPTRFVVERVWWGSKELEGQTIIVADGAVLPRDGESIIVPLARSSADRYRLQGFPPGAGAVPAVHPPTHYPVTAVVQRQLVGLLDARRRPNEHEEEKRGR